MTDHPPPMKHHKSAFLAVAGAYNDQVDEISILRARIVELEAENARLKVGRVREAAVVKAAIVWANDCPLGQRAVDKLISAVRALSGEREG